MTENQNEQAAWTAWEKLQLGDWRDVSHQDSFGAGYDAGRQSAPPPVPVPMILHCPECHLQHIDEAEPDVCEKCGHSKALHYPDHYDECYECGCTDFTAWLNPPHRKHRCHGCNHVFKPALINTTGVAELPGEEG